ncbi:MAG: VWA domain-containing protein [Acidimicrobiales bacterium]|nr:VWA domain-containing protein [Acidimicrobiales bacterium]MXZ14620.1 VWA domain-containing protein [Acidimicrobiales bacterium]MYA82436.1 VWA domain-containing protein [Acidimicrobiales bacterium]MYD33676.1 VWA domain-containing protein [Acidimicrobiales bacterium]MYG62269.1 VWA domain-containing protein [Acidimicrobiales bacterium]
MEFVARLVGFGHALRDEGLPVGSDDVVTFCSAVSELTPSDLEDVYWSGRTTLVHRRDHLALYDEVFRRYFLGHPAPADPEPSESEPIAQGLSGTLNVPDIEPGTQSGDDRPMVLGRQASGVQIQRDKRFAECTPTELAALRRIMAQVRLEPPRRRTRRRRTDPSGARLDIRRIARDAMRLSHAAPVLHRVTRAERARPLVLILDISGSMADYSRNLLQFAYSMRRAAQKVEVFCFGTRLTRITPALDRRNPDDAMKLAAARVLDWDGGTRIGASLDSFIRRWGRKGLSRGATVVICSDGLDRGEPAALASAMERLSRLCHRIIWMNPLVGDNADTPPSTLGMMAAGPFIDTLESGHDLASLEQFAAKLAHVG